MHESARAKINLFLHITGRRNDGYHDLQSMVVFVDAADVLHAEASEALSLNISGPFASGLPEGEENLVLRAAKGLQRELGIARGAALQLEKHLPVASGVGGGSADAAAALRLLARLWKADVKPEIMQRIALSLGSDVPACLHSQAAWMAGRGEILQPVALPRLHMLLVNPCVALSTAEVYSRVRAPYRAAIAMPPGFADAPALAAWLKELHNDLQPAALSLASPISHVLSALEAQPGCWLARLSGSGATCFGIFKDEASVRRAESALLTQVAGGCKQLFPHGEEQPKAASRTMCFRGVPELILRDGRLRALLRMRRIQLLRA